jgi:LysM repeat protein
MTVHSASTTYSHTEAEVGEGAPALSASRVASSSQPVDAKAIYEDPDLSPGFLRRHAASQARDALDDLVPVPSRTWRIRRAARDARGVLNHLRAPRRRSGQRTAAAPAHRGLSLPHVSIRVVSHLVLIVLALGVALGGRKTLSPQPAAGQGEPEQNLPSAVQLESRPYSIYTSKGDQTREEMGALVLSPSLKQPAGGPAFPAMHTVEAGETLDDIATEYNVSKLSIAASNGLLKNRLLAIGQQLRIPALSGIPYTIQEGDSLEDIAKRHGVTLGAIVGYGPNGR